MSEIDAMPELVRIAAQPSGADSCNGSLDDVLLFDFLMQRGESQSPIHAECLNTHLSRALVPEAVPAITFVFSGEGMQYFAVGRELFRTCLPFRESIMELDQVYASVVGTSLVQSSGLFECPTDDLTDAVGDLRSIAVTLPALTMVQLALVDAMAASGIHPDVVVGYSAGEAAVLSASGAASNVVALKLAIAQGRALSHLEEARGAMAEVSCTPDQARAIISEVRGELGVGVLEVACYNTPGALSLSGYEDHVELAVAKAYEAGIFARRLDTRVPLHSPMVEWCRAELRHLLSDIFSEHEECIPKVPVYSSVTGALFRDPFDTDYYWDGAVQPVLFQDAIEEMILRYQGVIFIEIGPRSVLTSYLRSMTADIENFSVISPLDHI
ncbi:FabD/lysophospholipase-like protein [Lentinus brumalis]|uniref:FabD/lysophospholipase-like protein n=1 Tax=Lentinus brumalis TaxID=2498619 RepID=A0A371CPZ5_9APHY|nr:FabD/lysophospholipase-like protein [Polyporus brumalis]